jgi:mannose-6-phosphate isomerase
MQAHPDRALAERLHKEFPEHYRDPNHKPEMACALTPFDAMCGFRPAAEIAHNVATVPELRAMIGTDLAASLSAAAADAASHPEAFKAELKRAFHAFMSRPEAFVMSQSTALDFRLSTKPWAASDLSADAVASRLLLQFPNDVGVFSPYLLNTIRLAPGEAIFLGANEPHAYLAGDCVEVMACSDNVVRAGLTPKFKDVDTLCNMLTYNTGLPNVTKGTAVDAHLREYDAPVPEFRLQRVGLTSADGEYALPDPDSAAIVVVVQGTVSASVTCPAGREQVANAEGVAAPPKKPVPGFISSSQPTTPTAAPAVMHVLEEGQVWLQPADSHLKLVASSDAVIFRAVANTRFAAAPSE